MTVLMKSPRHSMKVVVIIMLVVFEIVVIVVVVDVEVGEGV